MISRLISRLGEKKLCIALIVIGGIILLIANYFYQQQLNSFMGS